MLCNEFWIKLWTNLSVIFTFISERSKFKNRIPCDICGRYMFWVFVRQQTIDSKEHFYIRAFNFSFSLQWLQFNIKIVSGRIVFIIQEFTTGNINGE